MNQSESNTSDLCTAATQIFGPTFKFLITAEILVSLFVFIPNILLLSAVWNVTIFPSNLRLLLGHFSFNLLFFAVGTILKGVYFLATVPCELTISVRWCRIFDLATSSLALPNIYYSLFGLCIERLYASINYKKYDNAQKPWMAIGLICCGWATAVTVNGSGVFNLPNDLYVPFCEMTFAPYNSHIMPLYMALELLATGATVFIYFYTKYTARNMVINRALYNLSARFLVDQNVQVNMIILPSMAAHFLCHIPTFAVLIPMFLLDLNLETKVCLIRSTYLWRLLYAVVDPMIALRFNTHLRKYVSNGWFGRISRKFGIGSMKTNKVADVYSEGSSSAHFDYLAAMWSADAPAQASRRSFLFYGDAANGCKSVNRISA